MKKITVILLIFLAGAAAMTAQTEKRLLREGNTFYEEGKYNDAEISYRKALEESPDYYKGIFNAGDALYKQEKYEEAADFFQMIANDRDIDKDIQARAYHNLGNSYLQGKKYEDAIEAYKNSLRRNPADNETRYNLEYARKMLKNQQQQQQDQQNKDQNNRDQDKQQQDQQKQDQKNQDKDQKQDQQQQQQDKKDQDKQQQQQQQQQGEQKEGEKQKADQQQMQKGDEKKITPKDAQRILQALSREEKKVHEKLQKKKSSRKNLEKNW